MKTSKLIMLFALLFIGLQFTAQDATPVKESFKVWGNCDMCKSKIEKAVKSIDGVKYAKWNVASKKMYVKFYEDKTSVDAIQKAIADVGYDTEKYKAKDEVYNNLHSCCKYDRK